MKKILRKNFEENFKKKNLIHIITRKIPRGVLATRVCLALNSRNKSRKNFEENFKKKIWKKNWEKKLEKKFRKKFWQKIFSQFLFQNFFFNFFSRSLKNSWIIHDFMNYSWLFMKYSWIIHEIFMKYSWIFKKILRRNLEENFEKKNLIHIITRKIPRGVLATRVCLARNPRNKSRKNFEENF